MNYSNLYKQQNGIRKVNQEEKTPRKEEYTASKKLAKKVQSSKEDLKKGRENLEESSPDIIKPSNLSIKQQIIPVFISSNKKTILRKPE